MKILNRVIYGTLLSLMTSSAFATDTANSMPWDEGLSKMQAALTGSTAHIIIILAIAISGLSFAFGEHGGAFRRGAGIICGGSIAIGAATLATTLGISGAML